MKIRNFLLFSFLAFIVIFANKNLWAEPAENIATIPNSFSFVAEKAGPAVVNISTVKIVERRQGGDIFSNRGLSPNQEEFFENFFNRQMPQGPQKVKSLGSGFIINPQGYVITNNHVVEGAEDIVVRLSSGKEVKAEIIGRDPKTDLALIKLKEEEEYPFLMMANSDDLKVGDWVVAIGNPYGLEHTVTAGILSARSRALGAGPYDDFLQTDASINLGNSGGPLLNLKGDVVGINTAIFAGSSGIGFAIPSSLASGIIDQLKNNGRVVRGWIGVMIQKVTPEIAKSFNLKEEKGALIADVTPGGPAEKIKIQRGDIIIKFDDTDINDWQNLPNVVANTPISKKSKITLIRDQKTIKLDVIVAELPDDEDLLLGAAAANQEVDLGLKVRDLTLDLARKLRIDDTLKGVIIDGVKRDSLASEVGLLPGDLILEINRIPIANMADYNKIIRTIKVEETVLLLILRDNVTLFFTLEALK